MPPSLKKVADQVRSTFGAMSVRARLVIVAGTLVCIIGLLYFALSDHTEYATLFNGLSTEDAARITEQLGKDKIPFRLEAGGNTILVPAETVHETRLKIAGQGLPRGGGVGFEIFDTQKFGISDFAQQVNYRRALQGELERTITQLDAVKAARVHIALPERQVFATRRQPVSASVTLRLHAGRVLPRSSVKAVVHLVSSSIAGLGPDQVAVVDTAGNMLWSGQGTGGGGGEGPLERKQTVEETLERRVREILNAALGSGHAVVKVTADVALAQVEEMDTQYDPDKTAIRSESTLEEKDDRAGRLPAGIPGVRANLPGGPGPATGDSGSGSSRKRQTRNYEVNRTVRKRVVPAGEVKRLSVAVLVDSHAFGGVTKKGDKGKAKQKAVVADLAALEEVVKKAVGFSAARGDLVTLKAVPFAPEETLEGAAPPSFLVQLLRSKGASAVWLAAGLGVLLLVGFVALIRRRRRQQVDVIDLPRTVRELEGAEVGEERLALGEGDHRARELATDAARHDSLRAASVLRTWMAEE